jgi:hypothetical protein
VRSRSGSALRPARLGWLQQRQRLHRHLQRRFNARIASGVDPSLVAGAEIYAQYWSRDPASASHTGLSNSPALRDQP